MVELNKLQELLEKAVLKKDILDHNYERKYKLEKDLARTNDNILELEDEMLDLENSIVETILRIDPIENPSNNTNSA